ncbi:MAG: APC family permease [Eubacteriales bacterium]|nr:APC family permease [Eubacteriales bacterium]
MSEKNTAGLKKEKLSLLGVVALIFSFIAAGAFGIEEAIAASGPGVTLAMLVLFPFIWCLPLGEMISELGSLYPTEGGAYSWARESFGEFWGWQVGLWGALTTWLCQAQYVALVVGYASEFFDMSTGMEYAVKIAVVVIFSVINIMGLDWLEKLETVLMVLVLAAFGAVTVVGFMNWNYNPISPIFNPDAGLAGSIGDGIAIIIWMYLGYECMSNMAEEVDDPQLIPKATRISTPIIALSYILPTLAAIAALGSWDAWSTETGGEAVGYVDVLIQYVGNWAGVAFVIIAVLANCSIFSSYIAHGSRAFFVMADDNCFPKFMSKLDKRGIPTISIILLGIFTIITCRFDFVTLVMATTPIQLFLYLALVAAVWKLRDRYPAEERKKMGLTVMIGGRLGLIISPLLVFAISTFAIFSNGLDYFIAGFVMLLGGLIFYIIFKIMYKGQYLDDPELYPLNEKTHLGLGDITAIGSYILATGIIALAGRVFIALYEAEWGAEYYLEEYEEGIFSSFEGMLSICSAIGIVCILLGIIVMFIGKKTEGPKLAELKPRRDQLMDERICEIHGDVPLAGKYRSK